MVVAALSVVHAGTGRLVVAGRDAGGHVRYLADDVHMTPTGNGAPGAHFIQQLIDWLGQYGLWFALAAMIMPARLQRKATRPEVRSVE